MSYCSLIPKFAQIGSAQSLCPSIAKKCTNSAPSASSAAFSTSTYTGSGYRSVAFGTWAVGDASRCFEGRRRGKSATALESGRMGRTTDEEEKENGRREENEEKGGREENNIGKEEGEEREDRRERKGRREEEREKRKRHRNKEAERGRAGGGEGGRRRRRRRGESGREEKEGKGGAERGESDSSVSPSADRFRLSSSNLRSVPSATDHRRRPSPTLSRSLCDISADRKTMQAALMRRREPDLYSSSEYVRHNYGTSGRAADICHEKVAASHAVSPFCPSSVSSAAFAHRPHNAGCSLEALFVPPLRCPVPLSPCPSRISCPPPAQRPLRHILHPKHNNLSPQSLCHSPHQQQQFSFVIDPLGRETQRKRTKSLDNGLKLSLETAIRRRKDRICEGVPPVEHQAESVPGSRKSAICESDQLSTGASESRLEAAKNFLRRFYNHSTLRLTGRRRRRGNGTKRGDADKGTAEPPLMYSSALGPFFEMRKPQPAEMPFLPYNIHYTIESTDEASGASDDDADGAAAAVRRPLRAVSPQSEWSCCTPTCSSATITSPNRAEMTTNSTHSQNSSSCMAITANNFKQRQNAANANGAETYQHQQQHHQQHRHQRQQQFALTSSRTSAGAQLFSPVLPFFPSVPNSVPQMAPLSPSLPQHFVHTYSFQHQQSANDSLLNETAPTTPSVGYGSLKSSSDSSEGRRDNDGTAEKRRMIGPAEKRFADWNELFQYLKREIMEMNARDAQILRRLEGIQFELNGVRQMSGQSKRRPK
ncbi:hypothetical protein niasHS_007245 [Heterodera schachtii]|uniref:Uncharacterized protein n=1 Tax=Heterodera schachtii TaxID=97005 RepID=A0ABD2JJT1_HETSC